MSIEALRWSTGEVQLQDPTRHLLIVGSPGSWSDVAVRGSQTDEIVKLGGDRLVFLPAGTRWSIEVPRAEGTTGLVAIPVELISLACGDLSSPWRHAIGERSPRITDAVTWLNRRGRDQRDELVQRLLARLVASAFGGMARRSDDGWLAAAALARISSLVGSEDVDRMSLAAIARHAGLSVSAFSRGFRGSTGLTPGEFMIGARMERVASLLTSTDLSLTDIASVIGFASVPNLSQQFRARFGTSARRYRAANGNEQRGG